MTGWFTLDWALIAVSLFNTLVLLWLGLTVLLSAEQRTWGVWLIGGGMLLGGAFFISHTAILGHDLSFGGTGADFWWQVGWVPVVLAPYAWYVVILWYAGYWDDPASRLHRRHRPGLALTTGLTGLLLTIMLVGQPLPTFDQITQLDLTVQTTLRGIPLLFVIYPACMVLCITFSLDALRAPAPARRLMGDLARQRSRPWLTASAAVLLLVSLLVAGFIAWAVGSARYGWPVPLLDVSVVAAVAAFDLGLESLIGLAMILLGQAVVSYEVFTGKTLPRRGFFRHWRNLVLVAAGYSVVIAWTLVIRLRPVYAVLLTTTLMAIFYALFSWRSFVHRETFMARLRPFVSSQHLIQHLVGPAGDSTARAEHLFQAMCRDVLGASGASLIPLGVLAPLAGPPLVYPPEGRPVRLPPGVPGDSPTVSIVPLDSETADDYRWAIPLWAERGLIGALVLGGKEDGGLYTQEEVEIARAAGERIVDMLAGEQMARRLAELQRRRVAETRVMDLRTRRTLHDETLPTLHAAVLGLSRQPGEAELRQTIAALTDAHRQISDLLHAPTAARSAIPAAADLAGALRTMVTDEFAGAFDQVHWHVGETPPLDPLAQEVVFFAVWEVVRNAALHARGPTPDRPLNLWLSVGGYPNLSITVRDDGVGLHYPNTRPAGEMAAGSGRGLALHSTMLAVLGGSLVVEPAGQTGTQVTITLPPDL